MTDRPGGPGEYVVFGGAGFVGATVAAALRAQGATVTVIDRHPPPEHLLRMGVGWVERDVLTEQGPVPDGDVVLSLGSGNPRPAWTWTLPLDVALTAARVGPSLAGRAVTLISSIEVYGAAGDDLQEGTEPVLPWTPGELARWLERALAAAEQPCPPWRVAGLCRALSDGDPSGRWVYAAAKLLQEQAMQTAVPAERLTTLRLANTFGVGQERVVTRLLRRALAGRPLTVTDSVRSFLAVEDVARAVLAGLGPGAVNIGGDPVRLPDLAAAIEDVAGSAAGIDVVAAPASDSSGNVDTTRMRAAGFEVEDVFAALPRLARDLAVPRPLFRPKLPVVVPPRPARPDVLADRQQACLWTGRVKHGNRWSTELTERLAERLGIREDRQVLATTSGTDALRLAVAGTAGPARPGDVAAVPSFTFPATAEAVAQLGYAVRFVDVDPESWTMDPEDLERVIRHEPVRVVVAVDTFGAPVDYRALTAVCRRAGVPLVADSAAAFGAVVEDLPVGVQADAHAFSMSFAKVLSAGGGGGAVVLPAGAGLGHWTRSKLMHELHAASALDQLDVLDELLARRAAIADVYAAAVARFDAVRVQEVLPGTRSTWVHWVLRVPPSIRPAFMDALDGLGIGTRDYFQALHRIGWASDRLLPVTARLHDEVVALPMSSEMTAEDAERVTVGVDWALGELLLGPPVTARTDEPVPARGRAS